MPSLLLVGLLFWVGWVFSGTCLSRRFSSLVYCEGKLARLDSCPGTLLCCNMGVVRLGLTKVFVLAGLAVMDVIDVDIHNMLITKR
jgi:hypothetical protein